MKNIIDALTDSYSLEGEFEVQKSIQFIQNMEDIELLKPYAIKLLQTNARQAHFVSSAIELIARQQAYVVRLESKLQKKKATLWDRIRYVLFNKKSGNLILFCNIKPCCRFMHHTSKLICSCCFTKFIGSFRLSMIKNLTYIWIVWESY